MKDLDLILITNNVERAQIAELAGVNYVMVDLEIMGKQARQGKLNCWISDHKFEDVIKIKKNLNKAELLVRVNPLHENSEQEINKVINYGADAIMLPMFKYPYEVEKFINIVNGRVDTVLLLETAQALVRIDKILDIQGIDIIHIGLNDLHLSLNLNFMFELLTGNIVEYLSNKIAKYNIKYGFGGIAQVGKGMLPAEYIIHEHARLGSTLAILSRTFHEMIDFSKEDTVSLLKGEINKIKDEYRKAQLFSQNEKRFNFERVCECVDNIVNSKE